MKPARHGHSEVDGRAEERDARWRQVPPMIPPQLDCRLALPQAPSSPPAWVPGAALPGIRGALKPCGWWLGLGLALIALLALGFLRWAAQAGLPLPKCGFREATGLPCPACGSTRALVALTACDVAGAWRLNPLATSLMVGCAMAGVAHLTGRGARLRIPWSRSGRRAAGWVLAVLVLANWLYVIHYLPG